VAVRKLNLDGDGQADLTVHGGEHKAVCCYSLAHCDYWKKELPGRELPMGMFGENFTIDGEGSKGPTVCGDRAKMGRNLLGPYKKPELMGSEGGGEAFFGGVFVEVEELGGALEQIGGEIAGLIVDKAGGVGESDFATGAGHFKRAKAVEDGLDFAEIAFGKHEQEILVGESSGKIGAAAGFFHAAGKFLQSSVHGRQAVALVEIGKFIQMNGGETERGVLAARAGDFFAELLLDEGAVVQAGGGIDARRVGELASVRGEVLPGQLFALAAEGPLAVEHPAIEKKKKAEGSPTSLIGSGFVKVFSVAEQCGEQGERKSHSGKNGNESCGEPKPPLAARELLEAGGSELRAESVRALQR
jgi:hypothetical protein